MARTCKPALTLGTHVRLQYSDMNWRPTNDADKPYLWVIAGDLIPLNPKMERVPVQLDPAPGNLNSSVTVTITRNVYQGAQRNGKRVYFDGSRVLPLKIEDGTLFVQED